MKKIIFLFLTIIISAIGIFIFLHYRSLNIIRDKIIKGNLENLVFDHEGGRVTFEKDKLIISYIPSKIEYKAKYTYNKEKSEGDFSFSYYSMKFLITKEKESSDKYSLKTYFNNLSEGNLADKYSLNYNLSKQSTNSFSFKSLKKHIPFTEDSCKNLEGVYHGVASSLLRQDLVIYTLKEDKTEFYDGTVIVEGTSINRAEIYKGVYRKIGEEVEIEMFEKDEKTRMNVGKGRIERDQNGCILKLSGSIILERQPE